MSHEAVLAELLAEHERLQFAHFDFDDAWLIGRDLVECARRNKQAVSVDIAVNGQQLFHAALPGTSPDNDQWIVRKNRVVGRFFRSSYYIAKLLESRGASMEEAYGLSVSDYAPFGGAVPVTLKGTGVIGSITVSGLPDEDDHRTVVEAIDRHLARSRAACSPA